MISLAHVEKAIASAPRWLWIVLVSSVALNLLVLGAMASAWLRPVEEGWPTRGGLSRNIVSFVRSLPPERQQALREPIENAREKLRPLRRAVYRQRLLVSRLVVADPFDKAQFDAETSKLMQAETELRNAAQLPLSGVLATLTAEERKQLAAWDRHRRSERWRRRPPAQETPAPQSTSGTKP